MFAGASQFHVSGGNFQISHITSAKSGLEKLSAAAAHGALHDAPARTDETRCLQHTRTNVIDRLDRWAQGICDEGAPIFWLHGGAGAGKSAVMQTLCEKWFAEGLALGSFFFWRGDSSRNTAEVLVPTLAYQLAQIIPAALEILDPLMDRDPLIFKKSLRVQLQSLLVQPLQHLVRMGSISNAPQSPRVFLIDGLDECGDAFQQQAIIQVAAEVCHEHRIPVKFLIASRPEQSISASFDWYRERNHVLGTVPLSNDPDAYGDILRFVKAEFLKIRLQHPFKRMIPSNWPNGGDIHTLIWKSSSHFIFASTAMRYLWQAKDNPAESLKVILGLQTSRTISPFPELDALYHHILGSAAYLHKALQILTLHIHTEFSQSVAMLSLRLSCSEDDIHIYLADITALVSIALRPWGHNVRILHNSLRDFLGDPRRSGPLHIEAEVYFASNIGLCLQLIDDTCLRLVQLPPSKNASNNYGTYYNSLYEQVELTLKLAGHRTVVQEAFGQFSLLKLREFQLCFDQELGPFTFSRFLDDLSSLLLAVHRNEPWKDVTSYRSFARDFFHILDTDISSKTSPLVAATFKLHFVGYRGPDLPRMLSIWISRFPNLYNMPSISEVQLASILKDLNTSSECLLAEAAEVILCFLFDEAAEHNWARKAATRLFEVLIWTLPKAAISRNLTLYSARTNALRGAYPYVDDQLVRRIVDCLDEYYIRVQDAKFKELEQRVASGSVGALIEKSRLLIIDAQD